MVSEDSERLNHWIGFLLARHPHVRLKSAGLAHSRKLGARQNSFRVTAKNSLHLPLVWMCFEGARLRSCREQGFEILFDAGRFNTQSTRSWAIQLSAFARSGTFFGFAMLTYRRLSARCLRTGTGFPVGSMRSTCSGDKISRRILSSSRSAPDSGPRRCAACCSCGSCCSRHPLRAPADTR